MKRVALNFTSIKVDLKPTVNKEQSTKLALGHLVLRPSQWSSSIKVDQPFLAVQDSSIGDLVTQSVSESVSKTFDFSDFRAEQYNHYNHYNHYNSTTIALQ